MFGGGHGENAVTRRARRLLGTSCETVPPDDEGPSVGWPQVPAPTIITSSALLTVASLSHETTGNLDGGADARSVFMSG